MGIDIPSWVLILIAIVSGSLGAYVAVRVGLATIASEIKSLRVSVEEITKGERRIDGEDRKSVV